MYEKQIINDNWQFVLSETYPEHRWENITLPHDWAIKMPFNRNMREGFAQGFRDKCGIGWYKRKLFLDKKDECCYLYFDGIYENCTVWVNGIEAGGRKYGYSSFKLDVTTLVNVGDNEILVKVDNSHTPSERWYSGCGIYRSVYFETLPKKHIDKEKVFILPNAKKSLIDIQTGTEDLVEAEIEIENKIFKACGRGKITLHIENFSLWSAQTPVIYPLTLTLKENGHLIKYRVGIRDIEISPKGFFVNGKREKIKGVCVHQDISCFGIAVPIEVWRERLLKLKEIGCNTIRPSHHIFAPEFLDLCDELGFYVYEECFDKWTGGAYGRYYATEWKKDIETMLLRDRNHTCIIMWGIGNEVEFQGEESMLALLKNHCKTVRSVDPTRPVTCAINPHFKANGDVDITKIEDIQAFVDGEDEKEIYDLSYRVDKMKKIAEIVDVLALNYQEPWYKLLHNAIPDKAILGTEVYQYFTGYPKIGEFYTEKNSWMYTKENDFVIGSIIWAGFDYLGESVVWPCKGWSGAMFSTDAEPRYGSYIMKSYWTDKPFVRFFVMDYSIRDEGVKEHWDTPRYVTHWEFGRFSKTVVPFSIASNCDVVKVFLNGKELFSKTPSEYPNNVVTGFLPYEKGEVKVIGMIKGCRVCRHIVTTPNVATKLIFEKNSVYACENETLLIKVRAYDNEDNPVFHESTLVKFVVDGEGEIAGVDNGDLMSFEPYDNDSIHLYHGKASVAIKVKNGAERIKVTAYADGMFEGECIIIVK